MKPRILFVDDEPNILSALKRFTRPKREEWDMDFVPGGAEAIEAISQHSYDVVVSDMRMPGVSGATLLEWISQNMPGIVRLVLSGEANMEETYRIVGRSHRFLAKPCDAETLIKAISGALSARSASTSFLPSPSASFLDRLSTPIEILNQLDQLLQREDCTAKAATEIVKQDASLSARILQLVNSAYFGRPQPGYDIAKAVETIGCDRLSDLINRGRLGNGSTGDITNISPISPVNIANLACEKATATSDKALVYAAGLFVNLANSSSGSTPWSVAPYAGELLGFPQILIDLMDRLGMTATNAMSEEELAELILRFADQPKLEARYG